MALILNGDGTCSMVYPEGTTPIWLRPADRPKADPTLSPPKSVLLDTLGYVDDECNDTTAEHVAEDGKCIQVTFWMYHPPLVSYFTIHSPGLKPDAYPEMPKILATDGHLALLRIPRLPVNPFSDQPANQFFIYRVGSSTGEKQPSLRMLPNPSKLVIRDRNVGFLNYGTRDQADYRFFAAAFYAAHPLRPGGSVKFYINLFDSETWEWTRKEVFVNSPDAYRYRITNKVITIGGQHGSIAWVDLSHGILIYDALLHNNILRYIPLPPSELPDPRINSVRDMAAVDGCLKYVSMSYPPLTQSSTSYYFGDWKAKAWKMAMHPSGTCPISRQWKEDYHLRASEIMIDDPSHLELLPDLPNSFNKKQVLTKLHTGSPAVSLHDDGIVYIMTKVEFSDRNAWVLAVNTSTKALQAVGEFDAERCMGFSYTYTQSGISKHMGVELKEDQPHNEEDLWTTVSYKKKGKRCTSAGGNGKMLGRGMSTGAGNRGQHMKLLAGSGMAQGCGSGVSGAGKVVGPADAIHGRQAVERS
ncbi:uncharacterized protein [Aegilops tauschii subsp. strangulata]|nr:uncharacterized protein LOC109777594 [Aegilops tauschii subsp. strangulata]